MTNTEIFQRVGKVLSKIKDAKKILIVSDSSRPDWDCYGTALAIREWLNSQDKEVFNTTFVKIPEKFLTVEEAKNIIPRYIDEIDFGYYDLVLAIDSSNMSRLFGKDFQKIIDQVGLDKIINIDHHEAGDFEELIPDNTIRDQSMISTAQVFFEYLFIPAEVQLTKQIADLLYLAHCSDSARFMFKSKNDSLKFGQTLIDAGADFETINESLEEASKDEWDGFVIFYEHMKFWQDIATLAIIVEGELEGKLVKRFGASWAQLGIDDMIKSRLFNKIPGYNFGIFLVKTKDNKTRVSYRVRNSIDFDIGEILTALGMEVGGHKNAGGAIGDLSFKEFQDKFRKEMGLKLDNLY